MFGKVQAVPQTRALHFGRALPMHAPNVCALANGKLPRILRALRVQRNTFNHESPRRGEALSLRKSRSAAGTIKTGRQKGFTSQPRFKAGLGNAGIRRRHVADVEQDVGMTMCLLRMKYSLESAISSGLLSDPRHDWENHVKFDPACCVRRRSICDRGLCKSESEARWEPVTK